MKKAHHSEHRSEKNDERVGGRKDAVSRKGPSPLSSAITATADANNTTIVKGIGGSYRGGREPKASLVRRCYHKFPKQWTFSRYKKKKKTEQTEKAKGEKNQKRGGRLLFYNYYLQVYGLPAQKPPSYLPRLRPCLFLSILLISPLVLRRTQWLRVHRFCSVRLYYARERSRRPLVQ